MLRHRLHSWHCFLRDIFGIKPPKTSKALASAEANIDHTSLKVRYQHSALADKSHSCVLYRIIGNDLPPRHESGQSLRNLKFILEHESPLDHCQKIFLVNRIVDPIVEKETLALLESSGAEYRHIPFCSEEYSKIPLDYSSLPSGKRDYLESKAFGRLRERHKVRLLVAINRLRTLYVMNNNGARNFAIDDGVKRAKWVLPFDGNCFFSAKAWSEVSAALQEKPWLRHFAVPMARLHNNKDLLSPNFRPEAEEEPQLIFRSDTKSRFNADFPYGRFPKIEMFWHLGIPGNWSYTVEKAWDPPSRELSREAGQFGVAGWVARLYSGKTQLEAAGSRMGAVRGDARRTAMLQLFARLDQESNSNCEFQVFLNRMS